MRHGKKIKKIGRSTSHRKATLQSMSAALIEHKRITTTLGKARALRMFVEPILSRSKDTSTGSRRQAFRRLQNKEAVKELYGAVAEAIGDRPGGYTRVVKLGQRQGDAAEMAIIELVDFNDVKPDGAAGSKRKTRRSRRSGGAKKAAPAAAAAPAVADAEETPAVEAQADVTEAQVEETDASSTEAPADIDATGDAAVAENEGGDAPVADADVAAEDDQAGEAVVSEAANPVTTGNPVVPEAEAGDAEQGADAGTGEPPPAADAENQGRSGDAR